MIARISGIDLPEASLAPVWAARFRVPRIRRFFPFYRGSRLSVSAGIMRGWIRELCK